MLVDLKGTTSFVELSVLKNTQNFYHNTHFPATNKKHSPEKRNMLLKCLLAKAPPKKDVCLLVVI